MPRITDHQARRKDVLLDTIELYLNSALPVSSDALRKARKQSLSSASLRNVFSELEEAGLLTHPHTSAGRIPTDGGYRFYINTLMKKKSLSEDEVDFMKKKSLSEDEVDFINKIYALKVRELDDLLLETSILMSDFTHYASIVYFFDDEEQKVYFQGLRYILEYPEFQDVHKAHMVLEALERKKELLDLITHQFSDKTMVYIGKECACPQMSDCSVVVSRYAGEGNRSGRLALIGPKRMAYDKVIPLMDYISDVVTQALSHF